MQAPVLLCLLLCVAVSVTAKIKGKSPDERSGLLLLDSVTFPRFVPNANRSVVLFVWPQVEDDYGVDSLREDYYNFVESAEYQGNADNVLFAQMALDLEKKRNNDLAFSWDPAMAEKANPKLFFFPQGSSVPAAYPRFAQMNGIALAQWLSKKTIFYMGVAGTVQAFYRLAREFVIDAKTDLERLNIIQKTKDAAKQFLEAQKSEQQDFAELSQYYVKTMERLMDKEKNPEGLYVYEETIRLEDLVSGANSKLSPDKRLELQKRMNILDNFIVIEEFEEFLKVHYKEKIEQIAKEKAEKAEKEKKEKGEL